MAMSRRSPGRSRSRFTLVLLVLSSITLLTLDSRSFGPLESARNAVLGFFAPVGDAAESAFRPVGDAWNGATGYDDLRDENEQLRQQVLELEGQLTEGEAARRELEQLQGQLDLPFVGEIPQVKARVVTGGITNFDETIEIDKGSSSGIAVGMPVVAGGGLVGKIVRVADDRSAVQLLTDPASNVGVRVSGAPGIGIVQGQGDEQRLRASSFDITTELAVNDLLITAGARRSDYPPDIPVGRVTSVTADDASLEKTADVEMEANLNDLLYVTVLQWQPTP